MHECMTEVLHRNRDRGIKNSAPNTEEGLLEWNVIRSALSRPVLLAVGVQRHRVPAPAAGPWWRVGLAAEGALAAG